jgi:membrane-bound acyltransferase YfiQ involved in biofilm formation
MYNFISNKINIYDPFATNIFIIIIFVLIALIFLHKEEFSTPLSLTQTVQIRGAAIIFIVLGHLWTHVSSVQIWQNFAGCSVNTFLFISGYGIAASFFRKKINARSFIYKRIKKVIIPYWIATFIFILLDFLFLGDTLELNDLFLTISGVNLNNATQNFDYVRWYITFQLFWYFVFLIAFYRFSSKVALNLIFVLAFLFFFLDYYLLDFGWSQFFAFPLGCFFAAYKDNFLSILKSYPLILKLGFLLVCCHIFIRYAIHVKYISLPSIVLKMVYEMNSFIWTFSLVLIFGLFGNYGYDSRFLEFIGKYSYEIYLLHGPLLIKYNFVFPIAYNYEMPIPLTFFIFIIFISAVSIFFNKINNFILAHE